ncbi:hypothetical protein PILCRDRAFT_616689 [Piloderma croceum F 1598]|uniref:Uncharacterized protein n=1 Tax=Piloderma croceum (strain F 1598) TaxID=765440 RepID=A0A0C3FCI5_PILCF|nr:hypothetical protein PILCRDRAFT_616689 [Piloderma croceum F 1598]
MQSSAIADSLHHFTILSLTGPPFRLRVGLLIGYSACPWPWISVSHPSATERIRINTSTMFLENCVSLALIPDHDDDEAHLLGLVHSLSATYTRFLLRG